MTPQPVIVAAAGRRSQPVKPLPGQLDIFGNEHTDDEADR